MLRIALKVVFATFKKIYYICPKNIKAMKQRAYTMKEIAVRYFPNITPQNASRRLRLWIQDDPQLLEELHSLGYKDSQRLLSWACTQAILKRFGDVFERE